MNRRTLFISILTLVAIVAVGCATRGAAPTTQEAIGELTSAQRAVAVTAVQQSARLQMYRTASPAYVVDVEPIREKERQDAAPTKAIVTEYRYEGDLTIRSVVDLASNSVMEVEAIPHAVAPLSPEEWTVAQRLAMDDLAVKRALEEHGGNLEADGLLVRTMDQRDPIFGKRVVRVMFRRGRNYLTRPIVLVNLTDRKVTIEPSRPATKMHMHETAPATMPSQPPR